ncbi:hypothetical protein EW026_g7389 [Hermanssonia centrifuga]|uniref:VIT domain-containing protein n=1 Tax=Hermanssonia centrifuga TaxID=98765 RepID=A0A4S4K9S4_9APHY|nr:hypothetical protein EW026_g7389 [Hermanssonia centrifuga]
MRILNTILRPTAPMATGKPCGIVYTSPGESTVVYPPLEQLQVHAEIVDVSATVTLTQTFWQCSPHIATRAKYVFPVPARAAVCGFEMRTEDGRSITAVAKEKEEARRQHEWAIQGGKLTGLVEHVTDDVFSISLGSLPSLQIITTKLTYVLDLMDDDFSDQIRFQLPVSIGMRYGDLPAGMHGSTRIPSERISITTEVYMKGAIKSITSPSHSTLSVRSNDGARVNSVQKRVAEYRSPSFLSQDFVLSIKAEDLDAPRCFAQRGRDGSVAMQLTVVPKFNLPALPAQEYIFVVDRSGSMQGERIETAKRTLVMLMRSLPSKGTSFNIFSFGNHCDSLWGETKPGASLRVFTLGIGETTSTDMCEGIARVGNGVCLMAATSESIMAKCSKLVRASRSDILKNVSVDWGVTAELGDLNGRLEQGNTSFRQGPRKLSSIYAGNRFVVFAIIKREKFEIPKEVVLSAQRSSGEMLKFTIPVEEISLVRQEPQRPLIHTLAARRIITDLEDGNRGWTPFSTKAAIVYLGEEYQLASKYTSFIAVEEQSGQTLLSTGEGYIEPSEPQAYLADHIRNSPSAWLPRGASSSYITTQQYDPTISDYDDPTMYSQEEYSVRSRSRPRGVTAPACVPAPVVVPVVAPAQTRTGSLNALFGGAASGAGSKTSIGEGRAMMTLHSTSGSIQPSGQMPPPAMGFVGSARDMPSARRKAPEVTQPRTTPVRRLSKLFSMGRRDTTPHSEQPDGSSPPTSAPIIPPIGFSPLLASSPTVYSSNSGPMADLETEDSTAPRSVEDRVVQLVRLQSFDGSFPDSALLAQILGSEALYKAHELGVDTDVWATVLAVAYLQKYLAKQPELLEGLLEKAIEFIQQSPGIDFEALLAKAKTLVA